MGNGSVVVFGGGGNRKLFNIKVLNLVKESYGCALGCCYGVVGKSAEGKEFVLSAVYTLAEGVVNRKRYAIGFGKFLVKSDLPVIKQCVAVCEKKSRSYNSAFVIDVLRTGNNALHFAGHNVDGVIADRFYIAVGGVVVDSYKGHLLVVMNRLAIRADFSADRCFKGHSAEVLVILGINRTVGIHTGGNGDFVNMVFFVDHAFINNLVGCKGVFAVLVAVEGHIYGGRGNVHGDGVFFTGVRKNISAMNTFAVCASGTGFLGGADSFAALFAGNGHGVVAVAFCGVGGFGFSTDVVAVSGGNGDSELTAFHIAIIYLRKVVISQVYLFKSKRS